VERIAVVADRGYFKIEDIEACEKAGIDPYVPRPQRGPSVRAGLFRKDEFSYDPTSDSFLCPAGQRLHPYSSSLMRGLKKINYRNSQACRDCAIRSQCTGNQFRSVSRLEKVGEGSRRVQPDRARLQPQAHPQYRGSPKVDCSAPRLRGTSQFSDQVKTLPSVALLDRSFSTKLPDLENILPAGLAAANNVSTRSAGVVH
jgi:hypothetical protein